MRTTEVYACILELNESLHSVCDAGRHRRKVFTVIVVGINLDTASTRRLERRKRKEEWGMKGRETKGTLKAP